MHDSAPHDNPGSGPIEPFGHLESMKVIVPLLESLLDDDIDDVSMPMRAQLVMMMQWPGLPQAVCVQTAFGRRTGQQNLERTQRLITQAERRGVSVDEHVADLHGAGTIPHDDPVRLFLGESSRRPDPRRLERGILLMRASADAAPHELHQPMLSTIAWMLWAQGRKDDAMATLVRAFEIDATDPLTGGLIAHFSRTMPAWLTT
ncbi:hypothetical protein LK09_08415 [Microbacterium mangrovi]|uniref:Uncharacterized protein n=1 Tax=Microbacterium mangrovi TaxID=1348253 RepID=A0A0B2A5V7_9MICO|nr:hypothetical protein [Microbacterium mangrovi]KHK98874.1 hypothetical protein LK09_08415 [Microbacterium mangrovi]